MGTFFFSFKDLSEKNGARPYASEQAVENRAIFNKDRELLAQPLKVGDMVLSKGRTPDSTARGSRRKRGATLNQIHDMGTRRYVLVRSHSL